MTWPQRPPDGASNLEHALAYHEAGLWVLPGRDPLDVRQYREALLKQYLRDGEPDAHAKAQRKADRCAKHSFVQWRKLIERPSREQIEAWFTERPLRPVILLTGPGHGVCVVDVDTAKGADPLPWVGRFDLSETEPGILAAKNCTSPVRCDDLPWFLGTVLGLQEARAAAQHLLEHRILGGSWGALHLAFAGCLAATPSGGWHAYHLEADVASSEGSDGADGRKTGVAHGVDTRGDGGLVVAPSGELATPGRRWERWGEPSPFPLDEVTRRLVERQGARAERSPVADGARLTPVARCAAGLMAPDAAADREFVPDGPPDASRSFSHALLTTASDGQKNPRAKLIVGMLARAAPLPADARDAVLATLGEWCDLHLKLRGESAATVRGAYEREARAADRSSAFCLEVLKAWNALRCKPRWPEDKVEDTAASLWRSARAAEATKAIPVDDVIDPEDEQAKAEAEVDRFLRPLTGLYGADDLGKDLRRELLPCARLPLWLGPDGEPDRSPEGEHGHGLGDEFDEVLGGGLSPKMLVGLGAESAKSCKSMLVEQVIDGHCLRSAMVLSGALSGPVVVSYCLSEMSATSQSQRQLARWLGVDSNVFRRGVKGACTAPGLRRLAERLGREPASLAAEFLARADAHLRDGLLARARDLRVIVDQRALEPDDRTRPGRPRNHRRGVLLLQALAEAVRVDRARKAKLWGRSEDQILPLIFVDPIQRYQREGDGDGVGALDELVEEMRAVADEDELVMLFTSDTQKASAQGQHYKQKDLTPYQLAAHVFRGSYKLMHLPDLALVLKVDWPDSPGLPATASLTAALNRWGMPRAAPLEFDLYPECGRYVPRRYAPAVDDIVPQQVEQDEAEVAAPVPRKGGKFAPRKVPTP